MGAEPAKKNASSGQVFVLNIFPYLVEGIIERLFGANITKCPDIANVRTWCKYH